MLNLKVNYVTVPLFRRKIRRDPREVGAGAAKLPRQSLRSIRGRLQPRLLTSLRMRSEATKEQAQGATVAATVRVWSAATIATQWSEAETGAEGANSKQDTQPERSGGQPRSKESHQLLAEHWSGEAVNKRRLQAERSAAMHFAHSSPPEMRPCAPISPQLMTAFPDQWIAFHVKQTDQDSFSGFHQLC